MLFKNLRVFRFYLSLILLTLFLGSCGAYKDPISKNTNFDLIITDVNMPNMDGLTLIGELRKIPQYLKTPILVLTTERSDEMKAKGKFAGATGWIVKPFVPDQLLKAVNIVLSR